ncbi:hypothetical protein [Prevotella pectinovora]|jgi:hypothetical protein|nr:hypothetical protein [Prevotella pectinovora]MDY4778908.1 hypothetical protein [Prevotella pectinovora]
MKGKVIFTTALCLSAITPMMAQNITGKVFSMTTATRMKQEIHSWCLR